MISTRAHEAVVQAYERTVAVLREQLSAMQKQLDASIAREADARQQSVQFAGAAAFPQTRLAPAPRVVERSPAARHAEAMGATPWDELPIGHPDGTFKSLDDAALLSEDETAGLRKALGIPEEGDDGRSQ